MSKSLYILYESPTGYAVLRRTGSAGPLLVDEQYHFVSSSAAFLKTVSVVGFAPFPSAEASLEECVCVNEGLLSGFLAEFLRSALPKAGKKKKSEDDEAGWELGVSDPKLGSAIHEGLGGIPVVCNEAVLELLRLVRHHAESLLPEHRVGDIARAQCGLGHAFSRNKVKFNVHRNDNMLMQASALLEHMDGGVNQLGMRVKEWYGWHFPELGKEVPEPVRYARVVLLLRNRGELDQYDESELMSQLAEVLENDEATAARVLEKAKTSMGGDMAEVDWVNIEAFASRVVAMANYRTQLQTYLEAKMYAIAPNLTELAGQNIGAKLIAKAGSLTNLAKAPASTIQILGAEKALFRALKKKSGNTPKYGLIFHSSFIQRAAKENRGKISRYFANKAALACRIDCFMEQPPTVFGAKLREQVEARLNFFDSGTKPQSNTEAMAEAYAQYERVLRKRAKKSKAKEAEDEEEDAPKKKKKTREGSASVKNTPAVEPAAAPKKKKHRQEE